MPPLSAPWLSETQAPTPKRCVKPPRAIGQSECLNSD